MNVVIDSTEKNKRSNILVIMFCSITCGALFALKSSPYALIIYGIIAIISLFSKNRYIPFIMIGSSNYLPAVYGISPLVFCTILLLLVLMKAMILKRSIRFAKFPTSYPILLLIMIAWSFITGTTYNDLSFFGDLITISIFVIVLYLLMSNCSLITEYILRYFVIGLGTGLLFTALIKTGIERFVSTQPDRLAIGERADPNSTALLFAIFCIYIFIKFYDNLRSKKHSILFYGIVFVFGVTCLFLTQSRSAALCLFITIVLYILNRKKNIEDSFMSFTLKSIALILFLLAISLLFTTVTELIFDSWNAFYYRLQHPVSQDGERIFLFKMSVETFLKNPFMGTSLDTFKSNVGHIPHSAFSDYMVTNGIIGVIFYIFFFIRPMLHIFHIRKNNRVKLEFYSFFVCALNILFYSASNEKITFFLLIILIFSLINDTTKDGDIVSEEIDRTPRSDKL
ncbi:MAG: O-antigen ligase family protein [Eubacteriales bacterium]|nr:O-antigen ligase family protein [Eubacteriales bacterium]